MAEGANATVNYRRQDLAAAVCELIGGRGADLVFEHVGGEVFTKSAECLAASGRMVVTCVPRGALLTA